MFKKISFVFLISLVIFTGCQSNKDNSVKKEQKVILKDKSLESVIRKAIKNSDKQITINQVAQIEHLQAVYGSDFSSHFFNTSELIENIEGIQYLTNVKSIDLSYHKIKDISQLSKLTLLEDLNLNNNQVTNLKPLANMKKLKRLALSFNDSITDISPLEYLESLEYIQIEYNSIKSVKSLSRLPKLKQLFIDGNPIDNPEELKEFKNVKVEYGR